MESLETTASNSKETARVEAFSDGVFAIAITLLILEIHVPEVKPDETLLHALAAEWASIVAFLIGFFTILICWINHHFMFQFIHKSDSVLLLINGFKLLVVTITPFATAVLAKSIHTEWQYSAVVLYCFNFALMGTALTCLFHYAKSKGFAKAPDPYLRSTARLYYFACIFSVSILLISFWNIYACLALSGIMFAIFISPKRAVAWQLKRKGLQ